MTLITKSVALGHTSVALGESQRHILKTKNIISELLNVSAQEGAELDAELKNKKQALQTQLQTEWNDNSLKYRDLTDEINRICNNVTNRVTQMFRMTSSIREHYNNRIDNLCDMDEVKSLCDTMPQAVAGDISQQWQSIMEDAKNEVSAYLKFAMSQIDSVNGEGVYSGMTFSQRDITLGQTLNNIRNVIGTGLLGAALATWVFPPLGIVTTVVGAVWAWIAGREDKLEKNKAHLKSELSKLMDSLNHRLCDVCDGRSRSIVNEFIYELKKASERVIADSIASKKNEMKRELDMLNSQAQMSLEEKRRECERLTGDLSQWNLLNEKLKELLNIYEQIRIAVK